MNFNLLTTLTGMMAQRRQTAPRTLKASRVASFLAFTLVLLLGAVFTVNANSQNATFISFQKQVPLPVTFSDPTGIAVDARGDVFVVDYITDTLYKETPLSDGSGYSSSVIDTITNAEAVAIDGSGNLYLSAYPSGNVYKETLSGGSYTRSTIATGLGDVSQITADASGNVYTADPNTGQIYKLTLSGGSYTSSIISSGFFADPTGIVALPNGNLYVADFGMGVYLLTKSGATYTPTVFNGSTQLSGLAIDAQGNLYACAYFADEILKLTSLSETAMGININLPFSLAVGPQGNLFTGATASGSVYEIGNNFGSVNVGQNNTVIQSITALYQVHVSGGFGGTYNATTQGTPNMDFFDAGTGSCSASVIYVPGDYCTIDLKFKPTAPGTRIGSIDVLNGLGDVIGTPGYFYGTGVAPSINFPPGDLALTNILEGFGTQFIAIDSGGNLYSSFSTLSNQNGIAMGKPYESWQTIVTLPSTTFAAGLAVDGGGNLVYGTVNTGNLGAINVYNPATSSSTLLFTSDNLGNPLGFPTSVAVDTNENIYFADKTNERVYLSAYAGNGNWDFPALIASGFTTLAGIAVDAEGDVFVSDQGASAIYKLTPIAAGYAPSVVIDSSTDPSGYLIQPIDITIDSNGNLYCYDEGQLKLHKETPFNGGYIDSVIFTLEPSDQINGLYSHVMDAYGDFFFGLNTGGTSEIVELNLTINPVYNFAPTPVGQLSADSPKAVTFSNFGNAPLELPVPASGENPYWNPAAGVFTYNDSAVGACPGVTSASANPGILAANTSCVWSVSFEPTTAQSFSDELVIIDNHLNAAAPGYTNQNIFFFGQGTSATIPSVALSSSLNPAQYLSTVTFVATVTGGGATPTGTVTFYDGATSLGTVTLNSGGTASLNNSTLSVGSHSITAAYSGNSTYPAETSSILTEVIVTAGAPTVSLSSSANPALVSTAVTFVSTVKGGTPTVPTGTVIFKDGNTALATVTLNGAGTASFTTSTLSVGSHSITSNYSGDTVYSAASSTALIEVIQSPGSPNVVLSSSQNPAFLQNTVTLIANITESGATTPTGTVTFYDGTTTLGTFTLNSAAGTSMSTASLSVGTHQITASYSGDTVYPAATSSVLNEQIVDFTIALNSTALQIVKPGHTVTMPFTISMNSPATTLPADLTLVATGAPANSSYTFTPGTVTAGSGATSGTLVINIPVDYKAMNSAPAKPSSKLPLSSLVVALLLLPLAGRMRKTGKRLGRMLTLLLLAIAGIAGSAAISGCGGALKAPYEVTVTASSGSLTHTSSFLIIVE